MITSKQRSVLRALSNSLEPVFQIGKSGVSEVLAKEVGDALEARELVKITVLNNSGLDAKAACSALADMTGAEAVSCVGHRFVLYRQSLEHQKIFFDRLLR